MHGDAKCSRFQCSRLFIYKVLCSEILKKGGENYKELLTLGIGLGSIILLTGDLKPTTIP